MQRDLTRMRLRSAMRQISWCLLDEGGKWLRNRASKIAILNAACTLPEVGIQSCNRCCALRRWRGRGDLPSAGEATTTRGYCFRYWGVRLLRVPVGHGVECIACLHGIPIRQECRPIDLGSRFSDSPGRRYLSRREAQRACRIKPHRHRRTHITPARAILPLALTSATNDRWDGNTARPIGDLGGRRCTCIGSLANCAARLLHAPDQRRMLVRLFVGWQRTLDRGNHILSALAQGRLSECA